MNINDLIDGASRRNGTLASRIGPEKHARYIADLQAVLDAKAAGKAVPTFAVLAEYFHNQYGFKVAQDTVKRNLRALALEKENSSD